MNCQDIGEILDNGDIGRLDEVVRREAGVHTSGCASCARDWELNARFALLPDIGQPAGFAARCRAGVVGAAPRVHFARRRAIVLIAAASAAAAMLALYQWRMEAPAGASVPVITPASQPAESVAAAPVSSAPEAPVTEAPVEPARQSRAAPAPAPGVAAFSVLVMPLQNDAKDASGQAAVEAFHEAVLDQLRRIEGLRLVVADASDLPEREEAFQLWTSGAGPDANNKLTGRIRIRRSGPNAVVQPMVGQFDRDCVDAGTPSCIDATELAESLIDVARGLLFPVDQVRQQSLLAGLQDTSRDPQQRLKTLRELASPRIVPIGDNKLGIRTDGLRDPSVINAAIELAGVAPEAAIREEVWRRMRGIGNPLLQRPLVEAAQLDVDRYVRLEAVRTLGADFAGHADVVSALESVARADSSPLVRAMAQRGLKGQQSWHNYIVESLKDSARSDDERLEALLYNVSWTSDRQSMEFGNLQGALDPVMIQGAIPALSEVLPRVAGAGTRNDAISRLINQLQAVADKDPDPELRRMAQEALATPQPRTR